jgi:outer membrane protein assembly factor BamB
MNNFLRSLSCAAPALVLLLTIDASADNWPQWRGPKNDGISTEKNLPTQWSKTEGVLWRLALPGPGGATPVAWGDKVFVTSVEADKLVLIAANAKTGAELWKKVVGAGNKDVRGDEGNFASPSPCTDGEHVWTFMGNGDLACFDMDGNEKWKFNVADRYGKLNIAFGMSSTPVLDGDALYLQLIHGEGKKETREAKVVAINKKTGVDIWIHDRASDARDECEHSYASAMLYRDDARAYLLTHGADYIIAHDLKDGHELWRRGLNPKDKYHNTLRFVASPVAVPGIIVVPTAKNGPIIALRPDGSGDLTSKESAHLWVRPQNTPDVPSPLVVDGIVYMCRENGNLVAADAQTGEQFYEKATTRDRHRASPVYADGHIYLTARNGMVNVVKAGKEFSLVSQNNMVDSISASPAISGGRIFLRTFDALYAIGAK